MRCSESCKNMKRENEDRISELSDDILTSILSRLTLREAAATSVLSTRWRHLCAYATHLDFPPFKPPEANLQQNQDEILTKFQAYTKSIDHMLDSHKGNRVKEFRVDMHWVKGGANIDKWLQFAVAKQAEIIALCMKHGGNRYPLQLHKLLIVVGGSPRPRVLRELSLSGVDVDVELLLSSFPLLERLSLAACWKKLRKVSMVGLAALKHVAICGAPYLELVEIEDMMSLVSLRLSHLASPFMVRMNNAPKLVELSTLDGFNCSVPQMFARISPSIRAQLLTLKIQNHCYLLPYPTDVIPEFQSVKHLELECRGAELFTGSGYSLRRFFGVIQACPALEILEIKMVWSEHLKVKEDEKREIRVRKEEVCTYLKRIKLLGFLGSAAELGLALSILLHAKSLQEIIVEACHVNEKARGIATARAWRHLLPKIPSCAELQVI